MNMIGAFALGFAGSAAHKILKNNIREGEKLANLDMAARDRIFMASDQNRLYEDWKKHGPRWENGYFVPMD